LLAANLVDSKVVDGEDDKRRERREAEEWTGETESSEIRPDFTRKS
jgi:hypothetical protein